MQQGQAWTDWDIRLAKIIRSCWLFGQRRDMASMQGFARWVKPNGGLRHFTTNLDEVYFMRLGPGAEQPAVVPLRETRSERRARERLQAAVRKEDSSGMYPVRH